MANEPSCLSMRSIALTKPNRTPFCRMWNGARLPSSGPRRRIRPSR
jgi:hypothetical protein